MQPEPIPYTDFAVHVAPTAEGGTDVAIFGELDLATVDRVKAALAEAIAADGQVVIDLRACVFVDSKGIGALVEAALQLHDHGRPLVLRGVQPRVMRTLGIAGLTKWDLLEIEAEPESAHQPGSEPDETQQPGGGAK
jgi:anti-anti-sigma factor